jgi:uncharacterized protein YciI
MFVVLLRFSENRAEAGRHMEGLKAWLKRGFEEGVFLLAGSLQPSLGGGILARADTRAELEARVSEDPFVAADVVRAEILEITPSMADPRLEFLRAQPAAA